jgi:hypothetical protein
MPSTRPSIGRPHFCDRPYIRRELGDPPDTEEGQRIWLEATRYIEQVRGELNINHPDRPFGHQLPGAGEFWTREWHFAHERLASYRRRLARVIEESRTVN